MKASIMLFSALALAGCAKAVEITQPAPPIAAPVTILQVKFSPYFVSGSFTAALDGKDVTAAFAPVAAPAGTATMRLPDVPVGFTGGSLVPGSVPPPPISGAVARLANPCRPSPSTRTSFMSKASATASSAR